MMKSLPSDHDLWEEVGFFRQDFQGSGSNNMLDQISFTDRLYENFSGSILIIDPHTMQILDANLNAIHSLGYRRNELCQLTLEQIETPGSQDNNVTEAFLHSPVSDPCSYTSTREYRCKDGMLIPMEISSHLMSWYGQVLLIIFAWDIRFCMEDKAVLLQVNNILEQLVHNRTIELITENEGLVAALSCVTEAVAVLDAEGLITYVNPAFVAMSGYSFAQVKGQSLSTMFDLSTVDREMQVATWEAGKAWSGEVKGVQEDGSYYSAKLIITPKFSGDGHITGYIANHRNISDQNTQDKAQYNLISEMSHQLRTPLANIKLYTQLLKANMHNGKTEHYLRVLECEAERFEHLIQDINELARLDSDQSAFDWRPVELAEMLVQMTEANKEYAKMKQQILRCNVHGTIPPFLGDAVRLRQAFGEILDNAITYTPTGGTISVDVAVIVKDLRQWITVSVQDNGPGIAIAEHAQIFERFYRGYLPEHEHNIGSGLGLYIAQQIALAHNGHIVLESGPGVGAVFSTWLPLSESL